MESIEVYPNGTEVTTVIGEIKAIITGIVIRDCGIKYEISYFKDKTQQTAWVYKSEFTVETKIKKKNIGFK